MAEINPKFLADTNFENHIIGDKSCPECWVFPPKKCTNCGGLVHVEYYDFTYVAVRCENCYEDYKYDGLKQEV